MTNTLSREIQAAQLTATTRRHFLRDCSTALGAIWLATQTPARAAALLPKHDATNPLSALEPPRSGKVKRIIYLHMVGAPSQLELFEYKPDLARLDGEECPQEFLAGKRFAFIQGTPRMLGPLYPFKQYGETGTWVSDRLPHFSQHVDDVCFLRAVVTDQFNHGPAQLMVHTGQPRIGYPSLGSWVTWGLGSENENLPGFMVLLSGGRLPRVGKALWSAGFLPSVYQGVQCRSQGDPVLNISNPKGISRDTRRAMLDTLETLNRESYEEFGDPETLTRIAQYEMTFRMQTAVPEVMNIDDEPQHIHDMYGTEPGKESFANNCLLARRLAEHGVRFIQLYDWGWDSHGADPNEALNVGFKRKCHEMDRPVSALLVDLKQRGMLDDTLVIWGGEFGRTPMRENRGGTEMKFVGRDHNPGAFTIWLAGAGIKSAFSYGETDPVGYSPIAGEVHLRDLHATLLRLLGLDHNELTFPFQGLEQKLTGVLPARVVTEILSDT